MIYKTSLVEPLSTNFPHYLGGRWASGSEHPGFAFSALVFNLLSKRCKANSGPVLSGALFITAYCPNISVPKKDKDDCRIGKTLPFHNPWPCRVSSNFNKKKGLQMFILDITGACPLWPVAPSPATQEQSTLLRLAGESRIAQMRIHMLPVHASRLTLPPTSSHSFAPWKPLMPRQ